MHGGESVERDMTSASIATLVEICDALGLSVAELFQTPQSTLVRRDEHPRIAELSKVAEVADTLVTSAPGLPRPNRSIR
jgi:hypothetical protein